MFIFENDIKFQQGPFKMFDEVNKPNKIERSKGIKKKLEDRRRLNAVPQYLKNDKRRRYSYLSNK